MAAVKEVQQTICVGLGALLDAGEAAVVTLVAGETRLAAHRAVLAARSPVFQAMFQHDTLEASSGQVSIADVEGPVLRELLGYLYTLQAPQLPGMAPQLLAAADKYGVSALKSICEQQVAAQLTVENAAAAAVLAVRHSCPDLTAAAVAFIKARNIQVMATEGWADAMRNCVEDVIVVTKLLADAPPGPRTLSRKERGSRLIQAAKQGAVGEMQALLAAGADVGARGSEGTTALHWAAVEGRVEAVRCLLEGGAEVDARSNSQNTPLHTATRYGHAAVVRLLVAASADLNARNEDGQTPLHRAAAYGHPEVVAVLLEAGAD
ncbi:speckle-type POZ protein-like isoform X2 [Schistocerca americana]|uniref:speckle-type POZ protein-like isoform X2 n=1 Tax=Schistocerca americana TaxID=7009 RepID=UPI001F4F269A|nr:speckle-type POZ protein-like isoform X2 [Schistocerca americana]